MCAVAQQNKQPENFEHIFTSFRIAQIVFMIFQLIFHHQNVINKFFSLQKSSHNKFVLVKKNVAIVTNGAKGSRQLFLLSPSPTDVDTTESLTSTWRRSLLKVKSINARTTFRN